MGKKMKQIEGQMDLFGLLNQDSEVKSEKVKSEKVKSVKKKSANDTDSFPECSNCWCRDCKHNLKNEAIPRDFAGKMLPCPACVGCEKEGVAEICEIGSAKNGCHTRAEEENLIPRAAE